VRDYYREMDHYMDVLHQVDKRVATNVKRMFLMISIMPMLCGLSAGGSIALVHWLVGYP